MREYTVRQYDRMPASIDEVDTVAIDVYNWEKVAAPAARAGLALVIGTGFVFFGEVQEKSPRTVYKKYNDPVYTDSCIEFFARWCRGDNRYVNIEINSCGALLSCVGCDRHGRTPIVEYTDGKIFPIDAYRHDGIWGVRAIITFDMLEKIYGTGRGLFSSGYEFSGNFYKCGDECDIPHYVSWNPIDTEKPDFHRPEYFGKLIIG